MTFFIGAKFHDLLLIQMFWRAFFHLFSFETQRCELSEEKCAWSSKLKELETNHAFSLEPNNFMRITESNKIRLEFEPRIIEFRTPGDAHF